MKSISLALSLLLVGCQTPTPQLLPPPKPVPEPKAIAATPPPPSPNASAPAFMAEQQIKQQRQTIEALVSQNDALTAKLQAAEVKFKTEIVAAKEAPRAESVPVRVMPAAPVLPVFVPPTVMPVAFVTPNADGVIDLTVVTASAGDMTNPFAVRRLASDAVREIVLRVGGIIGGVRPGALVNERLMLTGDAIESLTLERCEPDAAIFRHGDHRLRLPINAQPVRVRLAL